MRLIDADALYDELYENMGEDEVLDRIPPCYVDNAPTVDAIPVVRCRDCKWFFTYASSYEKCYRPEGVLVATEDSFCSYGERRDQSADVRNMGHFAGGGKMDGGRKRT